MGHYQVVMVHYQVGMVHYSYGPVHIWAVSWVRGRYRGINRDWVRGMDWDKILGHYLFF